MYYRSISEFENRICSTITILTVIFTNSELEHNTTLTAKCRIGQANNGYNTDVTEEALKATSLFLFTFLYSLYASNKVISL